MRTKKRLFYFIDMENVYNVKSVFDWSIKSSCLRTRQKFILYTLKINTVYFCFVIKWNKWNGRIIKMNYLTLWARSEYSDIWFIRKGSTHVKNRQIHSLSMGEGITRRYKDHIIIFWITFWCCLKHCLRCSLLLI